MFLPCSSNNNYQNLLETIDSKHRIDVVLVMRKNIDKWTKAKAITFVIVLFFLYLILTK